MASQLLGIKTRFTDDLGSPLVGGQVYTYFAGTSTNQDSYSDAALTVPNTNPVILDDTGSADIFLKGSYRIRVFDKSGRFIEEQDNVTQAASQGDATELSNKVSAVESGLSTANTEIDKVKLDTGITATAKFGGVERGQNEKNADIINAADFGFLESNTAAQNLAALQMAADAFKNGTLNINAGKYLIDGDITLLYKGYNPDGGSFVLNAHGVEFIGTGSLILDSCKRVFINGLDMPTFDLRMRGAWWSEFSGFKFRRLVINDVEGTKFSSNYWNKWTQCQYQSVVTSQYSTRPSNEFTFDCCSMRGTPGMGFAETYTNAFEFNAPQTAQGWKFRGGDISYHTEKIYKIGATNNDPTLSQVELLFDGTYFDTILPEPSATYRVNVRTLNCHHANGKSFNATLTAAGKSNADIWRSDRSMRYTNFSAYNLVPNGDFRELQNTWVGDNAPVRVSGGATITGATGYSLTGNYININQARTSGNTVYFQSSELMSDSITTGVLVIRNADSGSKTIRVTVNDLVEEVTLDFNWRVITITDQTILPRGTKPSLKLYAIDSGFNIDVAYLGLAMGEGGTLLTPTPPQKTVKFSANYRIGNVAAGARATLDIPVPNVVAGDFAIVSPASLPTGVILHAPTVSTDNVKVTVLNTTAATVELVGMVWNVKVLKN